MWALGTAELRSELLCTWSPTPGTLPSALRPFLHGLLSQNFWLPGLCSSCSLCLTHSLQPLVQTRPSQRPSVLENPFLPLGLFVICAPDFGALHIMLHFPLIGTLQDS